MELKQKIKKCWDTNPMDYGAKKLYKEKTKEYYNYIDDQFRKIHFFGQESETSPLLSRLINYKNLKGKKVLEIGCGSGCIAAEFARNGAKVYAIDLSEQAIQLTQKRFKIFGLNGNIRQGDAENLPFKDNFFDFVFSWGVIHHTPGTQKAVDEIYRVLKSNSPAGIMVYHKNSISYYYHKLIKHGIFELELLYKNPQEMLNKYTDHTDVGGTPLAKVYTAKDIKRMFKKFGNVDTEVYGAKVEIDAIPCSKVPIAKYLIPEKLKNKLLQKYGWFLYIKAKK